MATMSWLRNTSLSFARQLSRSLDPRHDYEPQACYSSFCKHWQQAHDIIVKSQPQHLHDDVLGVVNHLEQLATLLVLEARAREVHAGNLPSSCLEFLLSENLLEKLYEWAVCTGKYENAVRLEQLKLFGNLIGHYSSQVIAAEPFLRPLLKLLSGFRNELSPPNLESQLVTVLNQLCVALMQNMKFIDLFFLTTHAQNGSQAEFIIVRLLLASVHREGRTGAAARDALLLCAKMSARCTQLADYMLAGNTCPVLATGLSGLYSLLPRTLSEKVYRLTPDDVNQVHKLTLFIDSVEFCNAVAQVAHPSITKHLLDLLYQGFLVPVMGPALLQTKARPLQSGAGEQTAAMAYLELLLRCVTPRGLLRTVLHFLFTYEYDGVRILDVLLKRLDGNSQLSLISLSLMETLIDLNCEDVMIELAYKHLLNGHHLMVTHRHKISDPEPYREATVAFLALSPRCCSRPIEKTREWVDDLALSGRRVLDFKEDENRRINGVHDGIAMNSLVRESKFNYGNPNETLYGNYHAYLCDARFEIVSRTIACSNWSSRYDAIMAIKIETNNNSTKETKETEGLNAAKELDSLISICTSGYDTLKTSDTSEKEAHSLNSLTDNFTGNSEPEKVISETQIEVDKMISENQSEADKIISDNKSEINNVINEMDKVIIESESEVDKVLEEKYREVKEHDSLMSLNESCGYDSFRCRVEESQDVFAEELFKKCLVDVEREGQEYESEVPSIRSWRRSAESIIGPLLSSLLKKAANLLEADITSNCRVTSAISKLAALPTPLLTSLLLCPGFVLQPNVPSLFQILSKLKEEVDELINGLDNTGELVDKARVFLIQREMALVKTRGPSNDNGQSHTKPAAQKTDESPFKRGEPKRRSLSNSFSMLARRLSSSSPVQHSNYSLQNAPHSNTLQRRLVFTQEAYWDQSITLRSILNAVILDEWVKELASLCEEHALRLSAENYEDDTYIKTVAL